jgi:hypothetical protein
MLSSMAESGGAWEQRSRPVSSAADARTVSCGRSAARGGARCCSGSALQITNSDQIGVSDCSHVGVVQTYEGLRSSGGEDELNLKTIRRMNVNNCTEVAATEPVFRQVSIQDDSVEQVEHDYPGCAVTKCGKSWLFETIQIVTTLA